MPGGRTKFQTKWLENRDGNGDLISNWCVKGKHEYEVYCSLCKCYISIANSGFGQLLQHTTRQKHISASKLLKGQTTLFGSRNTNAAQGNSDIQPPTISVSFNAKQLVTRAEALWAMKVAVSNFSFSSCKDIVPLFQLMFEGDPIANNMQLGERKVSYIISHGLGPYFHDQTVQAIKAAVISGTTWFTLAFDECTTSQVKKQLDIHIRYWNVTSNTVVVSYLTSIFLGHATADIVCSSIMTALATDNLPFKKLLMLSMDGPNVNLAVAKKVTKELKDLGAPELVDIGTCTLHKVHNSFSKALQSLPLDVDQLATDLFGFFKLSAARREDLKEIQQLLESEEKFLLRHVSSRWLTLGPVITRILTVYAALEEYFLNFLPKQKDSWNAIQRNARYQRIVCALKDPSTVVYLEFISALMPTLQSYLTLFQTDGPLIHILFNKMNELLRNMMLRFMKEECVVNLEGKALIDVDIEKHENNRRLLDVNVGTGTRRALSRLSESEGKTARMAMRKFLIELCKHLKVNLPIANGFLRDLEKLHPLMRCQKSENAIRRLCLRLKPLQMDDSAIDRVLLEWQTYRLDNDVTPLCESYSKSEMGPDGVEKVVYQRIDQYWADVLQLPDKHSGKLKYSNLSVLVKCCLCLAHGNADVERGFSINNALVSNDRPNLSETTIVGVRAIKDGIKRYGDIAAVPITSKLLLSVTTAHSVYIESKKLEQKASEELKRKRNMEEEEKEKANVAKKHKDDKNKKISEIDIAITALQDNLNASQSILAEGSERLQAAIKKKDFQAMRIASTLIETSTAKVQTLTKALSMKLEKKKNLQSTL